MHLKKCKLRVRHSITMDPFGTTPRAIGHGNYLVLWYGGTARARGICQGEALDTHVIKKKKIGRY